MTAATLAAPPRHREQGRNRRPHHTVGAITFWRCSRCECFFVKDMFPREPRGNLGIKSECKRCYNDGLRYHTREEKRASWRAQYRRNREARIARQRERREREPEKIRARGALNAAIWRGKIKRPDTCSRCGEQHYRIEGHHPDYTKPFDVEWYCPPCHRAVDQGVA